VLARMTFGAGAIADEEASGPRIGSRHRLKPAIRRDEAQQRGAVREVRHEPRTDLVLFGGVVVVAMLFRSRFVDLGIGATRLLAQFVNAGGDDAQAVEVGRDLLVELLGRQMRQRRRLQVDDRRHRRVARPA
jgi:hypothetical protein